jgi:GTP-binding protein
LKVKTAHFERSAHQKSDLVSDRLPQAAFAGRSNVGKSSLLNRLLGRRALARISSTPGRTRAINYFLVDDRCYFVDLPGYGYAKVGKHLRSAWARLIEGYFEAAGDRVHVIQLLDAKVGATPLDVDAYDYFRGLGRRPTLVATKADRLPRSRRQAAIEDIRRQLSLGRDEALIACSARTGEGIKEVWKEIRTFLETASEYSDGERHGRQRTRAS